VPANGARDAVTLGDTAQIKVIFAATASDAITLTESATIAGQGFEVADIIVLGDTAVSHHKMVSATNDALVLGESAVISGGGLPLLDQPITFTNPAGQPSHTNPFVSFGHPIARSDLPGSGYKLALYNQAGTTKITDLQMDQTTKGWTADQSINYAVVSGYLTGTTLAAGGTGNFRIKAIAGATPTSPVCTLATLAANSNIYAKVVMAGDTYTVSVNTIISAPPVSYPQHTVRQWKSGPYACEWAFGAYLQRDSDGGYHRWAFLKLYVTALAASGPFIVRGRLENPNTYGPHPNGTVGPTAATSPQIITDSIDVYNGTTHICALGGANDANNATFSPSNVNLATAGLSVTFSDGSDASALGNATCPIGFTSTGTLPAGLSPASVTTYWAFVEGSTKQVHPLIARTYATALQNNDWSKIATPVSGSVIPIHRWIAANGGIYLSTTAGTSTGALPTGSVFADNSAGGTLVWTLVSAQMTSQGTGTHTMVMKAQCTGGSKADMMGPDTYPFWSGAGSLPKLLVGYNRNYLFGKTLVFPPLDPAITCAPWIGTQPRYVQNVMYLPGAPGIWYIGNVSESVVDERVNQGSPTAMASICLPTDQGMAKSCRAMALSFVDRNCGWRDERVQEIHCVNFGPNRLGTSTYPGLPPLNTGLVLGGTPAGSPRPIPYNTVWTGYGGFLFGSSAPDSGHAPNVYYWPALTSGDPLFFDGLIEWASYQLASNLGSAVQRSALLNGVNYTWAWPFGTQTRSSAHCFQIFCQASWIMPDFHPARQYFTDVMDDSAAIGPLWAAAHIGPNGQSVGYMPMLFPATAAPQWPAQETWMMSYLHMAFMCECLKNNRPGFRSFYSSYFYKSLLPLWDSDLGGSEQLIDQQWDVIGNTLGGPDPPLDSQFLLTVPDRLSGNPVIFHAYTIVPPPTKLFIFSGSNSLNSYVYRQPGANNQAFPGNGYGLTARAVVEMGAMWGFSYATKIADRIQSFCDTYYVGPDGKGNFCNWSTQTTSGNPNGIMYAMKRQ